MSAGDAGKGLLGTAPPIIEVRDLSVVRGGKQRARVPCFDLRDGEVLAIMGPNGAGKSSLLLALALLIPSAWESYRFLGREVSVRNALSFRRSMAVVFQDPLLLDTTVSGNVLMGLLMRGMPREEAQVKVHHWLERLGVAHLESQKARTLSGGEAQRVSLARALALEPAVLLLDEPFSSLDVVSRMGLMKEIRPLLRQTSTSAVLVTHEFAEAAVVADRVMVMESGRVVQEGTPKQVLAAPASPLVATLVEFARVMAGMVRQ
ncbi:MAG: ATP-binding cassette domain-containing protein [Bacillota bacterium]|nr:ATP-binding cassette domain-containing protein [Bacillota bacterium]